VHGWPSLPEGSVLGEVTGVTVDSHNHVWIFHRGADPVVCLEASTGKVLQSWGDGFFQSAHGLAVDSQDNLWMTDTVTHQVFQFSHEGEILLTLGTEGVAGQDGSHFNKPTDIAIAGDGTVYVSDGYGNSRIAKFNATGEFLMEWGRKGAGRGEFNEPHGIAIDASGRVYVADRRNNRVQVFEGDGTFLNEWKGSALGRPWGIDVGHDDSIFVIDGGDMVAENPMRNRAVKLDLDGKIITKWGSYGNYDGQFAWAHDIAVGLDGAVYVVDVKDGKRVQKFTARGSGVPLPYRNSNGLFGLTN
jgi:DNA-binding beta-propeller fold protein YncE